MLGTAIIVFREVFEASLIIGIASAATREIRGRGYWISAGVLLGVIGAGIVAAFASAIGEMAEGVGQELFNAGILLAAVVMLGWHNVWMSRHGREMAAQMNHVGREIKAGSRSLYALLVVIALAVLREGSEVVLFLYGVAVGGSEPMPMLAGGALGLLAGGALGLVLYFGLLRIPMKHFFTVTSWLILLLAAGMAAQAARFLIQADLLPPLGARLWDTSALLDTRSLLGQTLHTLVGYDAHPSGMQLLFYVVTLIVIGVLMKLLGQQKSSKLAAAALTAGLALSFAAAPDRAYAGPADKVYKPIVEYGETEIEVRGGYLRDSDPGVNTAQSYILDLGHGFTPWWFTEVVGEYSKDPGAAGRMEAVEWENIFQLTEPGQYFADVGLFLEYEAALAGSSPNQFVFGPLLQKEIGKTVNNLNLLVKREAGPGASSENGYIYRFESQYRSGGALDLGVQGFGRFGHDGPHNWGPAVFGMTKLDARHKLKYDAGVLAGLDNKSPNLLVRWQVEYEF